MKNAGSIVLVLIGLGGLAYIFFVFLYPALKGGGIGTNTQPPPSIPTNTTNNLLASQGLAPVNSAQGTTANVAITDASSLLGQLIG